MRNQMGTMTGRIADLIFSGTPPRLATVGVEWTMAREHREVLQAISGYQANRFEGDRVAQFLDSMTPYLWLYEIGVEGSPVLYCEIRTKHTVRVAGMKTMSATLFRAEVTSQEIMPDEIDVVAKSDVSVTFRLWWD